MKPPRGLLFYLRMVYEPYYFIIHLHHPPLIALILSQPVSIVNAGGGKIAGIPP